MSASPLQIWNHKGIQQKRENLKFQNEKELLNLLKKRIDQRAPSKNLVALDADGTLWPEDANDILLSYEMRKNLRDFKDLLNPYYHKLANRFKLCELFSERQAGWTLKEFKYHCLEALKETPLHVFPFQEALLQYLKQEGMTVYVVTASMKWLVETAVELYNLPVDKVLGVETKLQGDLISSEILRPAPISGFKGDVFLKHSRGESCFLAGGNTPTDIPLLEMASVPFVVHSASPGSDFFSAEEKLKELAIKNNWILFQKANN